MSFTDFLGFFLFWTFVVSFALIKRTSNFKKNFKHTNECIPDYLHENELQERYLSSEWHKLLHFCYAESYCKS